MLDNPIICKDAEHYAVWGYLLHHAINVNEIDVMFGGKRTTLRRGQLIIKRKTIADFFHISESKVYRILNLFEAEHQIEQETTCKGTLVTVCNWSNYQGEQQSEQQLNNKRAKVEQQSEQQTEQQNHTIITSTTISKQQDIQLDEQQGEQQGEQQSKQRIDNNRVKSEQQVNNINKKDKNNKNNIHTQEYISSNNLNARVRASMHVHAHTREGALRLIEWIEGKFPGIASMQKPLTLEQADWIVGKYRGDDIRRIFAVMDSKQVWVTNTSAFTAFEIFAGRDYTIRERNADKAKYYTYGEVCDMVAQKGYRQTDFAPVSLQDGRTVWRKVTEMITDNTTTCTPK